MTQLALDRRPNTAHFSPCGLYRYDLTRELGGERTLVSIGLNPSKATAEEDDNTIRKDVGFARRWNCGRVVKGNAYAWCDTNPHAMKRERKAGIDVVGPENDIWLTHMVALAVMTCGLVVVSWGNHIEEARQRDVDRLIREAGVVPLCLGTNKNGTPEHELYVPYERELVEWRCP